MIEAHRTIALRKAFKEKLMSKTILTSLFLLPASQCLSLPETLWWTITIPECAFWHFWGLQKWSLFSALHDLKSINFMLT